MRGLVCFLVILQLVLTACAAGKVDKLPEDAPIWAKTQGREHHYAKTYFVGFGMSSTHATPEEGLAAALASARASISEQLETQVRSTFSQEITEENGEQQFIVRRTIDTISKAVVGRSHALQQYLSPRGYAYAVVAADPAQLRKNVEIRLRFLRGRLDRQVAAIDEALEGNQVQRAFDLANKLEVAYEYDQLSRLAVSLGSSASTVKRLRDIKDRLDVIEHRLDMERVAGELKRYSAALREALKKAESLERSFGETEAFRALLEYPPEQTVAKISEAVLLGMDPEPHLPSQLVKEARETYRRLVPREEIAELTARLTQLEREFTQKLALVDQWFHHKRFWHAHKILRSLPQAMNEEDSLVRGVTPELRKLEVRLDALVLKAQALKPRIREQIQFAVVLGTDNLRSKVAFLQKHFEEIGAPCVTAEWPRSPWNRSGLRSSDFPDSEIPDSTNHFVVITPWIPYDVYIPNWSSSSLVVRTSDREWTEFDKEHDYLEPTADGLRVAADLTGLETSDGECKALATFLDMLRELGFHLPEPEVPDDE